MPTFTHHYLTANKKLLPMQNSIEEALRLAEEKIREKLEATDVDILISHQPTQVIPELGISGSYTKEAKVIKLTLDVDNEHIRTNLTTEITRSISHEYMHAVREEYVSWENGTLLDSFIAEGLAQSFEIEIQPTIAPPVYATNLTETELKTAWKNAHPLLHTKDYEYQAWFFGSDKIKRWTGYSLGCWLVQNKMKQEEVQASELVRLSSSDFIPIHN